MGHTDDKSVVMCARGGEESLQIFAKSYKPGPHHDERGGGAVCGDGGDTGGDGGGRRSLSPLKTKQNGVGGGLMARILLWEMKTDGVSNEKCTESNTARKTRRRISDRK